MLLQGAWWLCRNIGCPDRRATIPGFGDAILVHQWLTGFRSDALKMPQMRSILAAELGATALVRLSDHAVVAQIARLLLSGRIHIHQASDSFVQAQIQREGASTKASMSAPVPRSGRVFTVVAPFREPPVDLPTFLADIDLPVQAATLIAAASSGKPFCPE
jgi:hypothetical protein